MLVRKFCGILIVSSITEPSNIDLDPMETEPAIPEKLQK